MERTTDWNALTALSLPLQSLPSCSRLGSPRSKLHCPASNPGLPPSRNHLLAYLLAMQLLLQKTRWSQHLQAVFCALAFLYLAGTVRAKSSECQPIYWEAGQFEKRDLADTTSALISSIAGSVDISTSSAATSTAVPVTISPIISDGDVAPGEINCRYAANTGNTDINYYTCTALARKYGISVKGFFRLNPELSPDCGNIKANTDYCVDGCGFPCTSSHVS